VIATTKSTENIRLTAHEQGVYPKFHINMAPAAVAHELAQRSSANYFDWPLWAQILLIVGVLTVWIPAYFVVELFREFSCLQRRPRERSAV
jgi:hypothetical protein